MVNPTLKSKEAREGPSSFPQKVHANNAGEVCVPADSVCSVRQPAGRPLS